MPKGRHATVSKRGRWRLKQSRKFTRRRFLIGSAGLVLLASAGAGIHWLPELTRSSPRFKPGQPGHLLNGTWDFQPAVMPLGNHPPGEHWLPITVPSEWNMTASPNFSTPWDAYQIFHTPATWDNAEAGWYRTQFSLSKARQERQFKILFEAINFAATVYVNGHWAGSHAGGTLPFTVDITPWAQVGANTLWVAVTGPKAIKGPQGFPYPMGSWWGQLCGGIWQNVWLIDQDSLEITNLTVQTSVRHQNISIHAHLTNAGTAYETVHVTIQVWDQAHTVLRHDAIIDVASGKTAVIHWQRPWTNAHWWSPDDPHLYEVTIQVRAQGQVRESASQRFGFREVWTNGDQLILNHQRIRLFGDEWHYFGSLENNRTYAETWFRMAKAAGANYVRLHAMPYPPLFYDVADEMGMLIVAESAIYGSSKNLDLTDPVFWVHAKEHLVGRVRRDRHHPSVILWSAENEILDAYGPGWAKEVASLKEPITSTDPTRPVYFEGDGDPEGIADLISWHYPLEITQAPALPHSFYAFARGGIQGTRWSRKKPLMISEFGLMWEAGPSILSVAAGNAPFYGMNELWEANALITQAQIEGFRAAGVTGVTPWNLVWYGNHPLPPRALSLHPKKFNTPGPTPLRVGALAATLNPGWEPRSPGWHANALHHAIAASYRRQAAMNVSWSTHAYAGGDYHRSLVIHNDIDRTETFTLAWRWSSQHLSRSGIKEWTLTGLEKKTVTVSLTLPAISQPIPGTWQTTLTSSQGTVLDLRQRPLTLYPRLNPTHGTLAVIDPGQHTTRALQQRGYTVKAWDGRNVTHTIVVGEHVAPTPSLWSTIRAALAKGGRVLVLAQPPDWSAAPGISVNRTTVTRTFNQAPYDPLVKGLTDQDLSWWQSPDDIVAQGLLTIPADASFHMIADGGELLSGASLVAWTVGQGQAWFCQYPVISQLFREPLAEHLLDRLVQASSTVPTHRTLTYWGSAFSPFFSGPASTSIPTDSSLLLADVSDPAIVTALNQNLQALRRWVKRGGRLWLSHAGQAESLVRQLTGWNVNAQVMNSTHQRGGLNTHHSPLTDGISNALLDWTYPKGLAPLAQRGWTQMPAKNRLIAVTPVDWSEYNKPEQIKTASVLKSTQAHNIALLWQRPWGRGQIIVDELNWNTDVGKAPGLRARLLAALVRR